MVRGANDATPEKISCCETSRNKNLRQSLVYEDRKQTVEEDHGGQDSQRFEAPVEKKRISCIR
jgi:hypothetical protein